MPNKVKVPGGAFYAGDGLTVDPITRTVSAGGGDVTTPDWNQNDETASDYIKNRPGGYDAVVEKKVQKSLTFNNKITDNQYSTVDSSFRILIQDTLEYGYNTVKVIFGDTTYNDVPIESTNDVFGGINYYVGDISLVEYPFCLNYRAGYDTTCYYTQNATVLVTVIGYAPSSVKIPSKYISVPNSIGDNNTLTYGWDYESFAVGCENKVQYTSSYAVGNNNEVKGGAFGSHLTNAASTSGAIFVGQYSNKSYRLDSEVKNPMLVLCSGDNTTGVNTFVASSSIGKFYVPIIMTELQLKSTTEGSTKRYKVTVDDTGALKATEVTT